MEVVAGSASTNLGKRIARGGGWKFVEPEIKRFPDGEIYVRVPEIEDYAVLVQTTYPNDKIIELFLLQDALREGGAEKIITVIPYFGYSRQDKIFKMGEAISARAMARHISLYSDAVITLDLHAESIVSWFDAPVEHLHATRVIGEHLKSLNVDVVISPDKGGYNRARMVAEVINAEFDYLEKTRISGTEVVIKPKSLDVEGRVVAIVDDIISTGGTIARAAEQLRSQGARKIYAVCTHGLFISDALENMKKVDGFASTDTIESEYSRISVAEIIVEGLKNIMKKLNIGVD